MSKRSPVMKPVLSVLRLRGGLLPLLALLLLMTPSSTLAGGRSMHPPPSPLRSEDGETIAVVKSETSFCSYLPPSPGGDVAEHEDDALPFCTQEIPGTMGAQLFPPGFLLSAHFLQGDGYVQVTGRIDPSTYQLSPNDEGGQYDSVGAPPGATCADSTKFVNLVDPKDGLFGIRCCTDDSKCETGRSEDGPQNIIPGDYS
jgi:hypothetical protein